VHRRLTAGFSLLFVGLGVALVVVTASRGGGAGSVGYLLGVLFVALGIGRLYLLRRR
jgi:hypothetical protein